MVNIANNILRVHYNFNNSIILPSRNKSTIKIDFYKTTRSSYGIIVKVKETLRGK